MDNNKTNLLLVMTILMLRKSLKFHVIGMHSCVSSLLGRFPEGGIFREEWYFLLSFEAHFPPVGL